MPRLSVYNPPTDLVLGTRLNASVPEADQIRQRAEVDEILRRLNNQPGVILADEVGMGKTFVALGIAHSVAIRSPHGPVIIMVPANLIDKWEQDLKKFCELYLANRHIVNRATATSSDLANQTVVRYGIARHSVDLMRLLDDPPRERCHFIFVAQGAMARSPTDKWIRLYLIAEALRRHGRGKANRLIQVKKRIHHFLAELLWAIGEERAHQWGEELWRALLQTDPTVWLSIYNKAAQDDRRLIDDPVPKHIIRAVGRIELAALAEALKKMPVRARGGNRRITERLNATREVLRKVERNLWKEVLTQTRWRSPLLIMDEAHHLKNPHTLLARQLQSPELEQDLRTGDGAMAQAFDRMLFLTATPFQLGHAELVRVLERFGDVNWDQMPSDGLEQFRIQLSDLAKHLDDSQRTAIALRRSWEKLRPEESSEDVDAWWARLRQSRREELSHHQAAAVDAYEAAKRCRDAAESELQPWIVRHNKGTYWADTDIPRRRRLDGATIAGQMQSGGLPIPPEQLLPFFLAARSAVDPGKDLLGEALCSSYEAFRRTRKESDASKDEQDEVVPADLSHSQWYLTEFDLALERCTGLAHPKIAATVRKVVDLWESGEKVLVFAFYRRTCRALRIHISQEIEQRVIAAGQHRLEMAGQNGSSNDVQRLIERIQQRYFDKAESAGRKALDRTLAEILMERSASIEEAQITEDQQQLLIEVMRRFLRVPTTLVRCFPITELDSIKPTEAIARTINFADGSGVTWRQKFGGFIDFLTKSCSSEERNLYLDAAGSIQTGGIRVKDEDEDADEHSARVTFANVQVATGTTLRETRSRFMRAFNTPFFPDILVCSQVMAEGVDLQRFCRHVIHHDLAWNPSTIEQRTGRVDRLGCKAEGQQPIVVYLPYLAGTADERQFQVMSEREKWFRVVMGEDEVARLITSDSSTAISLPRAISEDLSFKLDLTHQR